MTAELGREDPERTEGEYARCEDCRLIFDTRDLEPLRINGETEREPNGRPVLVCEDCAEAYK